MAAAWHQAQRSRKQKGGGRKQFVIPGRLTFKCRNSLCSFIPSFTPPGRAMRLVAMSFNCQKKERRKGALWQIGRTPNEQILCRFSAWRYASDSCPPLDPSSSSSWPGAIDKQTSAGACCRCGRGGNGTYVARVCENDLGKCAVWRISKHVQEQQQQCLKRPILSQIVLL